MSKTHLSEVPIICAAKIPAFFAPSKATVTPHIYGKKITKPFRKMGHVTIVDKDIDKARKTAQKVKETIRVIAK